MAELKSMDELRQLAEKEIEEKKNKTEVAVKPAESNQTSVMDVVKDKENELLQTKEVQELGRRCGEERIKSDLAKERARFAKGTCRPPKAFTKRKRGNYGLNICGRNSIDNTSMKWTRSNRTRATLKCLTNEESRSKSSCIYTTARPKIWSKS